MKWNSHLIHLPPAHNLLGHFFSTLSLPPSFMACWPWHLTVPPSDMPCCQEFSSSELCTTTNHILYNLDDSHSRNHESERKRQKWGSALRGGQNSQSKRCLLSEKNPPWFLWNTRRDGILYLLKCLQIADAVAECWCSDRWAKRAEKSASRLTGKLGCPTKD